MKHCLHLYNIIYTLSYKHTPSQWHMHTYIYRLRINVRHVKYGNNVKQDRKKKKLNNVKNSRERNIKHKFAHDYYFILTSINESI